MAGRGPNPITVVDGQRQCNDCKEWKSIQDFKLLSPATRKKTSSTDRMGRCHPCHLTWRREYRRQNAERMRKLDRAHTLKSAYGLTIKEYDTMLESQSGVCAICQEPERSQMFGKPKRLAVDHCHDGSERVRGLLCSDCNLSLGKMKDNPDLLRAAAAYLERPSG